MSETRMEPNDSSPPSTPRWVKAFGVIFIALAFLFGIMHLTGNSLGGPGSHFPPAGHSGQHP